MQGVFAYIGTVGGRKMAGACSGGYTFGFNGQYKDDEVYGEGNSYTAEFWQYDPRLGRRWNVDPKKRIWESDYSCFGNNPIFHIDVKGNKWKEPKDEQKANETKESLKVRREQYWKSAQNSYNQAKKWALKGNEQKEEEWSSKYNHAMSGYHEMQKGMDEIDIMGSSEMVFRFNDVSSYKNYGFVSYDTDGTVVINHVNNIANTAHELKHAFQNITGQIKGIWGSDMAEYVDLTDEVEAYTRQYYYSTNSMPNSSAGYLSTVNDITPRWVSGIYLLNDDGTKEEIYKSKGASVPFRVDEKGPYGFKTELINFQIRIYYSLIKNK